MKRTFTKEQLRDLAAAIADSKPQGALAGLLGMSTPTLVNKLNAPGFLQEVADAFDEMPETDVMEDMERWNPHDGERYTSRRLRLKLAHLIRRKFKEIDDAEQRRAQRRAKSGEEFFWRGGSPWKWNEKLQRWDSYGGGEWWNNEHSSGGEW